MDIFAHGLWTAALAKISNKLRKNRTPTKPIVAAFWGVFPDLFAFTHLFSYLILMSLFGGGGFVFFGKPDEVEPPHNGAWVFHLASALYQISHSLIIFVIVFGVVWCIRKKPYYELLGWLLHIIIDIPTHSYDFYPTPLLWPVSSWKFQYGISWGTSWFMKVNYLSLFAVYAYLLIDRFRKKTTTEK